MNCISAASNIMNIINGTLKNKGNLSVCDFQINVFGIEIPVEVIFDTDSDDFNRSFQFVSMVDYDKSPFDADSIIEIDDYIDSKAIDEWQRYINEP